MTAAPFAGRARFDAREKVRGATAYAADIAVLGLLYAMMTVPARIAKGTMTAISLDEAMRVPGVVRVLTPADFPPPPPPAAGESGPPPPPPSLETQIAYRG